LWFQNHFLDKNLYSKIRTNVLSKKKKIKKKIMAPCQTTVQWMPCGL
jgi:hypothetical protein